MLSADQTSHTTREMGHFIIRLHAIGSLVLESLTCSNLHDDEVCVSSFSSPLASSYPRDDLRAEISSTKAARDIGWTPLWAEVRAGATRFKIAYYYCIHRSARISDCCRTLATVCSYNMILSPSWPFSSSSLSFSSLCESQCLSLFFFSFNDTFITFTPSFVQFF